jgi:hypothetical protein
MYTENKNTILTGFGGEIGIFETTMQHPRHGAESGLDIRYRADIMGKERFVASQHRRHTEVKAIKH